MQVTPEWLIQSCDWYRNLLWSFYSTTNFGVCVLSLIIRTEVPGSKLKIWRCSPKRGVRWSSGSMWHSWLGSFVWRVWMIFKSKLSVSCSAAMLMWSQFFSVRMVDVEWHAKNAPAIRLWQYVLCGGWVLGMSCKPSISFRHHDGTYMFRSDPSTLNTLPTGVESAGVLSLSVHGFCWGCRPKHLIDPRHILAWICSRRFLLANVVSWHC